MDIKKLLDMVKFDKKKMNWNYLIILLLLVLCYIVMDFFNTSKNVKANAVKEEETKVVNALLNYEQNQKK